MTIDTALVNDAEALSDLLYRMNYAEGVDPQIGGLDALDRPVMAWLTESGGDDLWPHAAVLGGEVAERPEVDMLAPGVYPLGALTYLTYPVRVFRASARENTDHD